LLKGEIMSIPLITPDKGQVIHIRSIWADYCNGLVSPECVSWSHLLGLNVFGDLDSWENDLYIAAYEDTDAYIGATGEPDSLHENLKKGAGAFRFWWAAQSRLDDVEEIYAAVYLLADRVQSPSDFVLDRARVTLLCQLDLS
jgi:hypothetical protein